MDWPSGPGIPWPEIKGPGLKPYRFVHGFRGMNAPAPSDGTNNDKGNHVFCREFVEKIKMRRPCFLRRSDSLPGSERSKW
jgi:hypothetical protein